MLKPQLRVERLGELDPADILTINFPTNFLNDVLYIQKANHTAQSERKKVTWTLVDMMDLRPNTEQVIVAVISGARRFHSVHVY